MAIDNEKMRAAGLDYARKKKEGETGKETPGKSVEKKENKRTNREVLTRAVEKLEKIKEAFPKDSWERKRAEHTVASIKYAIKYEGKRRAPAGRYTVEVLDYNGNVAYHQHEGVPVDELIDILKKRAETIRKETTELKVKELQKKLADLEYQYEKEPTLYNKLEVYKQIDEVKREFDQTKKELDGGFPTAKQLDDLANDLTERSKTYFETHYSKEHGEDEGIWLKDERDKQDLRTRHEAHLIAKDYRATGSEEGDYKAAMEILKYRRELDLSEPEEEEEEKEEKKEPVVVVATSGPTVSAPGTVEPEKPTIEKRKIDLELTNYRINLSELAKRMAKELTDARLDEHYANSGFFRKMTRALTEKQTRMELYGKALEEIMNNQDLLKAMEARSVADQHLAGQQADKRGIIKKKLGIGKKEAARNIAAARAGEAHTATLEDWYQLMDSVFAEYEKEVVNKNSELGELLEVDEALKGKTEEMCAKHFRGEFRNRQELEAWAKQNLEPLAKSASKDKKFSADKSRQDKAGETLFVSNWWMMAEDYKGQMEKAIAEYRADCEAKGIEANEKEMRAHVEGRLNLKMQLGLKDRDMANNKPEEFFTEYEKFKNRSGAYKFYDRWGPVGKVLAGSYTSGLATRVAVNVLSRRGLLAAGTVAGAGAFASFGVPLAVGAGIGAYYGWKRRREQVDADIRHAQRYEALGGDLSSVLDAKEGLRAEEQMAMSAAIAELERIKQATALAEADKELLAGIFARMDLKKDGVADLLYLDNQTGKRFSSTQVADSQMKILRKELEIKFGLSGAEWQRVVGDARKFLEDDAKKAEANITKYERWEAGKAAVAGGLAGAAGGLFGQKLASWGMGKVMHGAGMALDKLHIGGSMFNNAGDYFAQRGTTLDAAAKYMQEWRAGRLSWSHALPDKAGLALFPFEQPPANIRTIAGSPAITRTVPGTVGGTRSFAEWLADMKLKAISGTNIAEAHTRGFYENSTAMVVDKGTGKLTGADLNELRFHLVNGKGGMTLKAPLLQYGSWHGAEPQLVKGGDAANEMDYRISGPKADVAPGGSERVWPDVFKLMDEGKLKFVLIPKPGAEAVYLDIDKTTGEAVVPKEYENLFDPKTGRCLADTYGTARVEPTTDASGKVIVDAATGKPKGYDLWWLNSDRNKGGEIDFGQKSGTGDKIITDRTAVAAKTITEQGSGYEMAPAMPTWRRKIYNKPKKEGAPENKAPKKQKKKEAEPKKISGELPEMTPEIAKQEAEKLVKVAENPKSTDAQVLKAAREFSNLDKQYKMSNKAEAAAAADAVFVAVPGKALRRIEDAFGKIEEEEKGNSNSLDDDEENLRTPLVANPGKKPVKEKVVQKVKVAASGAGEFLRDVKDKIIEGFQKGRNLGALRKKPDEENTPTVSTGSSKSVESQKEVMKRNIAKFESNPFSFFFGSDGFSSLKGEGIDSQEFVRGVKDNYRLTDADMRTAEIRAKEMGGSQSMEQKQLIQLARLALAQNPLLREQWKTFKGDYEERLVKSIVVAETEKDLLGWDKSLPAKIDVLAKEFGVPPLVILKQVLSSHSRLPHYAHNKFLRKPENRINPKGNTADEERVYREVLDDYVNGKIVWERTRPRADGK